MNRDTTYSMRLPTPTPLPPTHSLNVHGAWWAWNPHRPMMFNETQSEYKVSILHLRSSGGTDSPQEPELASNTERRQWHSEKHEWTTKWSYHNLSYLCYFSVLANHISWKPWHGRKGKDRVTYNSFPFLSYLANKLKVERAGRRCEYQEKKNSQVSFVDCFHCSGENKIRIHVGAIRNGSCNFGNSIYELNALIPAFKTGITQYKDE